MKRNAVLLALMLLVGCEGMKRKEPEQSMERTGAPAQRSTTTAESTRTERMSTSQQPAAQATPTTGSRGTVATSTEACACDCEKLQARLEESEQQRRARLEESEHHHHARRGATAAAYPTTAATVPAREPAPAVPPPPPPQMTCPESEPQSCPQPEVTVVEVRQERLQPAVAPLNRAQRREQRRAERYAAHHGVSRRADETRTHAIKSMGGGEEE